MLPSWHQDTAKGACVLQCLRVSGAQEEFKVANRLLQNTREVRNTIGGHYERSMVKSRYSKMTVLLQQYACVTHATCVRVT